MAAYYNDFEPVVCDWLRELIARGELPPGDVDQRSIWEVEPADVRPYTQAHFFAGIGGWPLALRWAGWPDDRHAWTGSCPCQSVSLAGKRKGHADDRHLWPAFHRLIAECAPAVVLGEQVAGALGREWMAAVRLDLEDAGYACGVADLPAASVEAPHIRHRLFWLADGGRARLAQWEGSRRDAAGQPAAAERDGAAVGDLADAERDPREPGRIANESGGGDAAAGAGARLEPGRCGGDGGVPGELGDAAGEGRNGPGLHLRPGGPLEAAAGAAGAGGAHVLADAAGARRAGETGPGEAGAPRPDAWGPESQRRGGAGVLADGAGGGRGQGGSDAGGGGEGAGAETPGPRPPDRGGWDDLEWLPCTDGKWRPTQPGLHPLAHGVPGRVGRLRAYGNAIVPQVAEVFVRAAMDVLDAG